MALSKSIPTGQLDASGNPINATYWQWGQINIEQIPTQTCMVTLLGYASAEAFAAAPGSPLMTEQFSFPGLQIPLVSLNDSSGNLLADDALTAAEAQNATIAAQNAIIAQFPFDAAYLAANYSAFGIQAQLHSAMNWVTQQAPMVGATVVA